MRKLPQKWKDRQWRRYIYWINSVFGSEVCDDYRRFVRELM